MTTNLATELTESWQTIMQQAVSDVDELLALVQVDRQQLPSLDESSPFAVRVPRSFIQRMQIGAPNDPLLRQVLPLGAENNAVPGFVNDPLEETDGVRGPGIVSKYHGRTLLITTGACPVHCRYCFRRHFPYQERALRGALDSSLAILETLDHDEVILSGGDPLSLSNARLGRLFDGLGRLPHLKRLRIHTRFPVIVPQRVDQGLMELLTSLPVPLVLVTHINHAQEIDANVAAAIWDLRTTGATLLNQAVLLDGINATATAQANLAETLLKTGVVPYYLHQLDPVAGAAHFQVSDRAARTIMAELRTTLPGYLVPRLVRETPGEAAKTPLA